MTEQGPPPLPQPTDEEREHWRRQALIDGRRGVRAIPSRYAEATADHPDVAAWMTGLLSGASEQAGWSEPAVRRGPSLLILGAVGTGKTWQAYGAMRTLLTSGVRCRVVFSTAADLYARLRPRHGVDTEDEFARCALADVLVIDDLGASKASEWTEEVNYRLVNSRYERECPTLFTSNVPPAQLSGALGDRVASRLLEMTSRVVLKGSDRRRQAR